MLLDIDYQPCQGHVEQSGAYQTFFPPPPLSHWVQCFWQLNVPVGNFCYRSMPDNSVDWIININDPEKSFIITPFSSSIVFELTGPVSFFGVRFRILGYEGVISAPLGEWASVSDDAGAAEVLPDHVLYAAYESINKSTNFIERCKYMSTILLRTVKTPSIDLRLARYIRYCHNNINSNISLSDKQCSEFGLSSRQLRRLTQLHLGLTPRDFSRVFRFQHMLKILDMGGSNIAWAGHYYDQSHYIREFKSLSGLTPTEFRKLSALYNHELGL